MAGEGEGESAAGGVTGGAGSGVGERTVPYDRFQRVVSEKNELRAKIAELEGQAQQHAEKAATADTLASQLKDLQTTRTRELAEWDEERGLMRAGFADPDAIAVARLLHGRLPEKDRPALGTWLEEQKKDPTKAPKALTPWLTATTEAAAAATGAAAGAKASGNADTRTGQRTDGQQRAGEPMSAEKIREMREQAQKTGDWTEWKKFRGLASKGS